MTVAASAVSINNEEQRLQRLERKEMERIAKRFRVITPQEFEKNLNNANEANGTEKTSRAPDSWSNTNNGAAAHGTAATNALSTDNINNDTVMDV